MCTRNPDSEAVKTITGGFAKVILASRSNSIGDLRRVLEEIQELFASASPEDKRIIVRAACGALLGASDFG